MTQATGTRGASELQLYDVDEAAAILRVSRRQLYQLVRDKKIPSRKVEGVSIRFSHADLKDIIDSSYRPAVSK